MQDMFSKPALKAAVPLQSKELLSFPADQLDLKQWHCSYLNNVHTWIYDHFIFGRKVLKMRRTCILFVYVHPVLITSQHTHLSS
jgi:hypothetical protein